MNAFRKMNENARDSFIDLASKQIAEFLRVSGTQDLVGAWDICGMYTGFTRQLPKSLFSGIYGNLHDYDYRVIGILGISARYVASLAALNVSKGQYEIASTLYPGIPEMPSSYSVLAGNTLLGIGVVGPDLLTNQEITYLLKEMLHVSFNPSD